MSVFYRFFALCLSLFVVSYQAQNSSAEVINSGTQINGATNKGALKQQLSKLNNYKSNFIFNIGVGTTGPSISAAFYFNNFLGVRLEYAGLPSSVIKNITNSFGYGDAGIGDYVYDYLSEQTEYAQDYHITRDNLVFNTKMNAQSWGFDLSLRPFRGVWRVDVGIRNMNYSISAEVGGQLSSSQLSQIIQDQSQGALDDLKAYNIKAGDLLKNDTIKATVSGSFELVKGWRPYFGTGWDFNIKDNFTFSIDLGIMYMGDSMAIKHLSIDMDKIVLNKEGIENSIFSVLRNDVNFVSKMANNSVPDSTTVNGQPVVFAPNLRNIEYNYNSIVDNFANVKNFDDLDKFTKTANSFFDDVEQARLQTRNILMIAGMSQYEADNYLNTNIPDMTPYKKFFNDITKLKNEFNKGYNTAQGAIDDVNNMISDLNKTLNGLNNDLQRILHEKHNIKDQTGIDISGYTKGIISNEYTISKLTRFYPVIKFSFGYRFNIG